MDYNIFIADMYISQELEGFYILKDASAKTTAAGKPFLSGVLSDITGSVEMKVWDYTGPVGASDIGKVVKIRGIVTDFKGSLQVNVSRIRLASAADSYDTASLVPAAPIDPEAELQEVYALVAQIGDSEYQSVCRTMLERHIDEFRTIPAAKSVHHGFTSGLLMHTSNMMKLADFLAGLYPDALDKDLLLSGTLLHDFAKAREFAFSELGMVTDYTVNGNLLGHLVMGAQEICDVCRELNVSEKKSVLLQHMILSHHGKPEFGAAVIPQCAEAELLYYIDCIDSRMEIYAETLATLPEGSFSPRIFALEKRIFNHG